MSNSSQNPLLSTFKNFDGAAPFDQIQVKDYMPAITAAIATAKKNLEEIKRSPGPADFENTIVALEMVSDQLDRAATVYANLETAHGSEELQALAAEIYPTISAFSSDVSLDPEIFARVKFVNDNKKSMQLTVEQARLLEKSYLGFVRNGALLDAKAKEEIRGVDQELAVLSPKYSENLLKATNAFELFVTNKADLDGLPDGALEAAAAEAEAKGKKGQWLFTLQFPSYLPLVTYAKNRSMREKIWRAMSARAFRGEFDNQEIILKIVRLKTRRANLLGYKTHAEYVLAERMAKDPLTVTQFLDKILKASKAAGQRDLQEVRDFAKQTDGLAEVQPWDFAFYSEKLKESKYAFNEEDLRPYFKLENVVEGVFEHARRLYGLQFKKRSDIPVYQDDVVAYEITDAKGAYVGLFYTDFFPRETKKGGAWMTSYREQGLWAGKVERPHISIVCNFTKPTPTKPSLLTYDEVLTLFHEFGHALHGMLANSTYRSLSGTNVYWDFVELPSQIMENWAGEKESLDLFAKHYQTGAPIPADLVAKLKKAQRFQSGWMSLRQVQFAQLDMAWYSNPNPEQITDVDAYENVSTSGTRLFPKIDGTNSSCSFSHIFAGGYSAGYYSYKWAEVLDADAFELFKEKGLFDRTTADAFREHVLSRGGTEHPGELYKRFRGRDPDPDALLRRDGLI